MQNLDKKLLMTGMLAGVTAALLALGAVSQAQLSFILYPASALPILIVGLGWGNTAAIAAVLTAAFVGATGVSPMFALSLSIFTLIPAAWLSHLANLARPASEIGGPDHLVAWYPLSDILLHLCGLVAIALVILGVMIGFGPETVNEMIDALIGSLSQQNATMAPTAAELDQLRGIMPILIPFMQGASWVMLLFAAYYIATRVVGSSGRSLRPREDMPSALRMNRNASFIFLAGILATFAGGVPAMIGATICGTFGAGFLMAGFASLHLRTRGKDWRLPALIIAYLSSLMLLPTFIIFIFGLLDTRRTVALTPARTSDQNRPAPSETDSDEP
ncbi:DUF2232 domain-containing protein [Peteryoungia desertarenae]|uniref:DUF2232 domain-containing protein n=1 Tax=Peteryoungia desertarenae TaxID=1813451 RepID=A0ABX6QN03_9HYPH|nr:DUF2232 domain-containing protein [Peteryoungia desertarenae]QLF69986.1 DUF2232 domain-containing protein [Peteryoungia desertarenae]